MGFWRRLRWCTFAEFKNSAPREFPKCEAMLFYETGDDPLWTCDRDFYLFSLKPPQRLFTVWILFYKPQIIFSTPTPPHSQNHHGCSCHSTTLNHREMQQQQVSSQKADRKIFEAHVRWSFNSARSTDRDFLQSSLCLSSCCLGDSIIVLFRESTKHSLVFRPAPVFEAFQHYFPAFWVVIEMKNLIFWLCAPSSIQVWFESVYKFVLEVFLKILLIAFLKNIGNFFSFFRSLSQSEFSSEPGSADLRISKWKMISNQ